MDIGGGSGKVAVLVTAETKQALKQLREVNKQTKETAKTSQSLSKSMGAGMKKFGIIAVAALTVVTGGFYAMLRASSYAEVYTKRWQAEQTLIANEWVRRHRDVFDRVTDLYLGVRKQYVGTGKPLGVALEDAFGVKFPTPSSLKTSLDINVISTKIAIKISKTISNIQKTTSDKLAEGNKRLIDYSTLWINTYIRPIHDFIKSIFEKVTEILALVPGLGINVEYNVYKSSGGGGGEDDEDDDGGDDGGHNPPPLAPSSTRALGGI